jgi:hypothetical protein
MNLFTIKFYKNVAALDAIHMLTMDLVLQSLFGLHVHTAHCTAVLIGWYPATPLPPPAYALLNEGAIGQPR